MSAQTRGLYQNDSISCIKLQIFIIPRRLILILVLKFNSVAPPRGQCRKQRSDYVEHADPAAAPSENPT